MIKNRITALCLAIAWCGSAEVAPYGVFSDGNLANTKPEGWIAEWLGRQRDGLTGHPEALSYPYDSCLWAGTIERQGDHGSAWWRYEQTAYYTDGLLRLGLALGDGNLVAKAVEGIDYTLEHASPEGYLGHACMWDSSKYETSPGRETWPMTVFFRAMKARYDATGDERIPAALRRYYLNYTSDRFARYRNLIALEGVLWTYAKTGDKTLLELAEDAWRKAPAAEEWPKNLTSRFTDGDEPFFLHGVTASEELKIPVLLAEYTGDTNYLASALNAIRKIERDHLLPDGCISSTEQTRGNSVHWGHETCNVSDFTWSLGYFLEATGDAKYGDMIEKCVFNAGFGSVTKDFRSLQYFSNLNQFVATADSDHNPFKYGGTWMQYRPTHETECCAGNVSRFLPNYVSRMWLTDRKGDPVAALHGPSRVEFPWGSVTAVTRYPYDGRIRYVFAMKDRRRMDFGFRVPGWAEGGRVTVTVNGRPADAEARPGSFASVGEREFSDGDTVEVEFPMSVRRVDLPRRKHVVRDFFGNLMATYGTDRSQGSVIVRGPLLYAYPIPTERTEDTVEHANMNGKRSANPDFRCWTMKPSGPFAYALCDSGEPLAAAGDGSWIEVPAKRIRWELEEGRFTPDVPSEPEVLSEDVERIRLIPYGLTCLRLAVFPVVGSAETSVYETGFDDAAEFAERWTVGGAGEGSVVCTGGVVRLQHDGDRITWRGELPEEYGVEAVMVNNPGWSDAGRVSAGARWAGIESDYGNFSVGADGRVSILYVLPPPATQTARGGYAPIAGYADGEEVRIRLERRRAGAGTVAYSFFVNGTPYGGYTAPKPKRGGALVFSGLRVPFELRGVKIFALRP